MKLQPEGNGVFTFKSNVMQHGHMIHINDPLFEMNEVYKTKPIETDRDDEEKSALVALWRAREVSWNFFWAITDFWAIIKIMSTIQIHNIKSMSHI